MSLPSECEASHLRYRPEQAVARRCPKGGLRKARKRAWRAMQSRNHRRQNQTCPNASPSHFIGYDEVFQVHEGRNDH